MNRAASLLFAVTLLLSFLGLFILYESSSYTALLNIGDKYYFLKNQSVWLVLGIVLCMITSRIPYKKLYSFSLPLLVGTIILLVAVFLPGIGLTLKGAHRWINLGFTVLQPSELLKISLTVYLAAWLSFKEKRRLIAFLLLVSICILLVVLEPDMGTAMIIAATATFVYFFSGASLRDMSIIGLVFIVGVAGLIAIAPYRVTRFAAFTNFNSGDLSSTSYHVKQVLISLGSGGLTGVGFGKSVQKYAYLPENTTDSIFAIYAEESGFIGSTFLVALFFINFLLGFIISLGTHDPFGRLLAFGITIFIGIQTLINLASQVVILPLVGVPLPFISYGGSSMVINFIAIGLLLSVARSESKRGKA